MQELEERINKEYEFLAIFDFDKEELKKAGTGDKYMTEFKEKIECLNNNKRYKQFLSVEEDMRKINNAFKEIGRREGIEIGALEKIQIAKNLLNMKMSIENISKTTGLIIAEIQKL